MKSPHLHETELSLFRFVLSPLEFGLGLGEAQRVVIFF